jgi:alpha-amylase
LNKVSFALVIHSHQPVGNFDHVIEEAYQKAYAPFVQILLQHPRIRLSLHYSGILLEWLEERHPEYFDQLRELFDRGQVELLGGGYYEPILPSIPDADKISQLRKLADYLHRHWGKAPRGAWVAERVWEPSLAYPLAQAGVEYVLLDDTHFLAAGLQPSDLRGVYITEEQGAPLRLVPSLKSFRYTIPFQEPQETLRILSEGRDQSGHLFAVGDDCEKLGVWPGTYAHVYQNGWLERFLQALEGANEWLQTCTISDYMASHAPLGRVYLPTASYAEMMEWALPTATLTELKACLDETNRIPDGEHFRRFLQGGFWRNFLSKYPESNQIQKLSSAVSRRWQQLNGARPRSKEEASLLTEAQSHVLASQCNDAYWHGVFGGLYAPHLRSALLRNLIRAEALLDKVEGLTRNPSLRVRQEDFDVDGHEEVLLEHPTLGMIIRPADGGTVSSLRFKPAQVELVNSLTRRPETYHALVRKHVGSKESPKEGPASIHDMVLSKKANLDVLLRYDRYARHMFRTYVFSATKGWRDFSLLRLDENEVLACGPWKQPSGRALSGVVRLESSASIQVGDCVMEVEARKTITAKVQGETCWIECRSSLSADRPCPAKTALGTELVINLLAPSAPDRYFMANEVRRPLDFRGEIDASNLTLVDEWQGVRICLDAHPRPRWWIVPIETISQSELGFERVYQGSAILAVWKIDPASWQDVTGVLRAEVSPWVAPAKDDESEAGGVSATA